MADVHASPPVADFARHAFTPQLTGECCRSRRMRSCREKADWVRKRGGCLRHALVADGTAEAGPGLALPQDREVRILRLKNKYISLPLRSVFLARHSFKAWYFT